ncbi:MAG: hypothetical protein K8L91_33720 [Anaerolineae bacterium]|nr:hypothetical protein [Anaerolineae bacterium]
MATLPLPYENRHFVPLEAANELEEFQDGDVIEVVEWTPLEHADSSKEKDEIDEMLDRTRGLWAEWPEDVEALLEDTRRQWDEVWQERLKTLSDFWTG